MSRVDALLLTRERRRVPSLSDEQLLNETVDEFASDLGFDRDALYDAFLRWLNRREPLRGVEGATVACYAIYRIVQSKSAFRSAFATIERRSDREARRVMQAALSSEDF